MVGPPSSARRFGQAQPYQPGRPLVHGPLVRGALVREPDNLRQTGLTRNARRSPQAHFNHPVGSPLAGRTGIVMAYAVVHPAGSLLFDTGIGTGSYEIETGFRPVIALAASDAAVRGLEPDDVVALACSHLHFDHGGQNAAFPGRPDPRPGAEREAHARTGLHDRRVGRLPRRSYIEEDGDDELLPGVRLIPTPGHTPGHQIAAVDGAAGTDRLVGSAPHPPNGTARTYRGRVRRGSAWDPVAYRASVERLRALEPDVVLFGRDDRW